jgi:HD-like signal output (HDOD) protein
MKEKQVFKRLEELENLATLPEVLAEILRVIEDQESPLDELARIILKDVPLTARVLSAANSAAYGRQLKVSSIRDAVMTLGARTIRSIALSMAICDFITGLNTELPKKDFWKHSIEVAVISELLAERVHPKYSEEAYIAGLFHDIGILVLDTLYPREYAHIWEGVSQRGEDLLKLEEMAFGTTHNRVGSYVLSKWNLPQVYAISVMQHHDTFELKEASKDQKIPEIINLAEKTAKNQFDFRGVLEGIEFDNRNILMKNLGISNNDMSEIETDIVPRFLESAAFLEVDVGSSVELLAEANLRIFELYREVEDLLNSIKTETDFEQRLEFDRLAVEILHTVVATFSHYFNNACASILGRSQLIEMALNKGDLEDHNKVLSNSLIAIQNGVNSITGTLQELKQVKSFKTTLYHEKTLIIDLEDSLKKYKPQKTKENV